MSAPGGSSLGMAHGVAHSLETVMRFSQSFTRSLALSCLAVVIVVGAAVAEKFEPRVGQPGKDVVWVPTPQALVDRMLDMAKVTPNDFLMDLGSGDGRTVITAAKRGVRAQGVEFNPNMVALARENATKAGATELASFQEGDLFAADISKATVITLFLLPDINLRLRPKILDLKPGTRIVSNSFDMGDWTPDQTIQAGPECTSWCRAHLWLVPAKVGGTWKLPDGGELTLEQKYQVITGSLRIGNSNMNINTGKVIGDQITFTAGTMQYTGRVNGNTIEGIAQTSSGWRATR
jgi:methyltransferase family protein